MLKSDLLSVVEILERSVNIRGTPWFDVAERLSDIIEVDCQI
jgi:hypothetical protein